MDKEFEMDARWYVNSMKLEDLPEFLRQLERFKQLVEVRLTAAKMPPRREPATIHTVGKKA
jgi:hypothetical protein